MGNSCTRNSESQVVLSEQGVRVQRWNGSERGRWSAPNAAESVDLDTLLEAPSPPAPRRRRKKDSSLSSITERFTSISREHSRSSALPPRPPNHRRHRKKSKARRGRSKTEARRKASGAAEEEEPEPIYHSYEDPGYLMGDPVELQPFDNECILGDSECMLGSAPNSPTVIHARWGEPVDDPDEENVCTDFVGNPFKLGFCINCQKQHDVTETGDVVEKKNYKKIARPTISKTAANALDNPDAVPAPRPSISHLPEGGRESDIDLAQLLTQRREVLMKLNKIEQQKKERSKQQSTGSIPSRKTTYDMRHSSTMYFGDTNTSLGNLRRMTSRPPSTGPLMSRATSASVVLSPRATSYRNISKSVSVGSRLDDEEPAQSVWL